MGETAINVGKINEYRERELDVKKGEHCYRRNEFSFMKAFKALVPELLPVLNCICLFH